MKENVELSVIVPIYNLETCLPKCLDSILNQTYKDFELILIDDGSDDGSLTICRQYQKKDDRIRIFHQENGGVSSARNLGLDNARGSFIAFVDGDDLIEPEVFERLMEILLHEDVSIACCQLDQVMPDGRHVVHYQMVPGEIDSAEIASLFFDEGYIKECMYGPFNKIFRRTAIGNVRFQPYRYGEDILFVFETLCGVKNVVFDSFVGYHYVQREGSAMKSGFSLNKLDYLKAAREVDRLCVQHFAASAGRAHRWVYRHALITVRQLIQHGMTASLKDYITTEKGYLKANAACLSELPFRFRINYWLVMYFPFLVKILLPIKEFLKR